MPREPDPRWVEDVTAHLPTTQEPAVMKDGVCPHCNKQYRTFHQWQDLVVCPRCGGNLDEEDAKTLSTAQELAASCKLEQLIQDFLAEPRRSDGGYAPVERQDMLQLYDILQALIESKWEPDPDGDYPINYILVDRTQYEPNQFLTTRYLHKMRTEQERMYYMRDCMTNVRIAQRRLDTVIQLWMIEQAEKDTP